VTCQKLMLSPSRRRWAYPGWLRPERSASTGGTWLRYDYSADQPRKASALATANAGTETEACLDTTGARLGSGAARVPRAYLIGWLEAGMGGRQCRAPSPQMQPARAVRLCDAFGRGVRPGTRSDFCYDSMKVV
jgi:hypothetical protein